MTTDTVASADTPQARLAREAMGAPRRNLASRVVNRMGGGVIQLLLVVVAVSWLIPTTGLFISSLRSESDNSSTGWWTAFTEPSQLTWQNYQQLVENETITGAFWNTVLITLPATFLVVVIGALAAYAFAWMEFPGRDWLFLLVVGMLVVPVQLGLIPVAQLYGGIDGALEGILGENAPQMFGTVLAVVLFHVGFGLPFAIFLLRNYFAGIPRDLLEAARMDGATETTLFGRVVLPLGLPAIASLGIFQFLWVWNDLLIALVFASRDSQPLTVALASQTRQFGTSIDVLAPGAFLSLIVPLIVFFGFQRYFVQGVLAGSVK